MWACPALEPLSVGNDLSTTHHYVNTATTPASSLTRLSHYTLTHKAEKKYKATAAAAVAAVVTAG